MNKEERFFYMKNAAQKSANMAEENHLELLGAMCDEKNAPGATWPHTGGKKNDR